MTHLRISWACVRVNEFSGLLREMQSQGYDVETVHDLRPALLGLNGYVGCWVKRRGVSERIWISLPLDRLRGDEMATTAEWLTETLVKKPQIPVGRLFKMYRKKAIAQGPPIEQAIMLSRAANLMGFVVDPLGQYLELPAEHPLRPPM